MNLEERERVLTIKTFLFDQSRDCWLFSRKALGTKNAVFAMQYLNQAFQCSKVAQLYYVENCERGEIELFEYFLQKFDEFNREFIDSCATDHSLQHSHLYLQSLEEAFSDLKIYFGF